MRKAAQTPLSLDRTVTEDPNWNLYSRLSGARTDPAYLVEEDERRDAILRIVGTLDADEVARMSGSMIRVIQSKLLAAGVVNIQVAPEERERLRSPERRRHRRAPQGRWWDYVDEYEGAA